MLDFLFASNAGWFSVPAIVGTFIFILRLAFMFIGGVGDAAGDVDFDLDVDAGADIGDADIGDHPDPGQAFRLLSVQSIAAFMMGFGLAGFAAYRGSNWGLPTSIIVATAFGIVFMWIIGTLMKMAYRLESSGNVSIRQSIGLEANVYVTVPPAGQGAGQVNVIMDNRQRLYRAVTEESDEITRNTAVRVVRANDAQTVTVCRM